MNRFLKQYFSWFSTHSQAIYFDHAATTHKPEFVIAAESNFYREQNASVHRGLYDAAESATSAYEEVRTKIAEFIGAAHSEEIIFTAGATDGLNMLAQMMEQQIKPGDELLVTQAEHHANLVPWQQLAVKTGAVLKFFPLDKASYLIDSAAEDLITSKTTLISVPLSSNVLGPIWHDGQLEAMIKKAQQVGAKIFIDAAAAVAHQKLEVQKLGIDALVFSGHKMLAPSGIGVLYLKKSFAQQLTPVRFGGSMVYSVSFDGATWANAPKKFEAGTPPIAQVIGLGAAIDFYNQYIDFKSMQKHEAELCSYAMEKLNQFSGIRILGNQSRVQSKRHLLTFVVDKIHAHDLAAYFSQHKIMVRAGHHCAQPLANLLQAPSSVRVSFFGYNTVEEIDVFIAVLEQAIIVLRV